MGVFQEMFYDRLKGTKSSPTATSSASRSTEYFMQVSDFQGPEVAGEAFGATEIQDFGLR
jgi:hypothetical protein